MPIETELAKFDGKNIAALRRVAQRYTPDTVTVDKVVSFACSRDSLFQSAATWLLKHWTESGLALSQTQCGPLIALLNNEIHWQSRLHILQLLPTMSIEKRRKSRLHRALMSDLTHQNRLVRAWAYGGLAVLAARFPELKSEAERIFEMATRDETAAVKARIRNARKLLEPGQLGRRQRAPQDDR